MKWSLFSSSSSADAGPSKASSPSYRPPTALNWETTCREEFKRQEALVPTTDDVPSCMTLLDDFLHCYALIPAMRGYYRYGYVRSCSDKWDDVKYCMSMKSEGPEERRRLWMRRKAEWWAKRRIEGSSEDVWEIRKQPPENFPPNLPDNWWTLLEEEDPQMLQ